MREDIRRLWARLNSTYWFYPALFSLASVALALGLIYLDRHGFADSLNDEPWLVPARPQSRLHHAQHHRRVDDRSRLDGVFDHHRRGGLRERQLWPSPADQLHGGPRQPAQPGDLHRHLRLRHHRAAHGACGERGGLERSRCRQHHLARLRAPALAAGRLRADGAVDRGAGLLSQPHSQLDPDQHRAQGHRRALARRGAQGLSRAQRR